MVKLENTPVGFVPTKEILPDPVVTQAEAEAGVSKVRRSWTAERVKQAILALAPAGSATIVPKVRYVSPTGNNATAVVGDISKPYLTVQAAVSASVEGDCIAILPGSYTLNGPVILKKNSHLLGVYGSAVTHLILDGSFRINSNTGGSAQTDHGGYIQPSPGVTGVDRCQVSGLKITALMPPEFSGTYTAVTGVNTATGFDLIGTGASFCDMYIDDCDVTGTSDIHFNIDAAHRVYYNNCILRTSYDFIHLLGPNNNAYAEFSNCRLIYRPFYDLVNFIGLVPDTYIRIRSGGARLKNCSLELVNDGTTDWGSLGFTGDTTLKGIQVDDKEGAYLEVIGGLPTTITGGPPSFALVPRFCSSAGILGTASKGAVIVDGFVPGLANFLDTVAQNAGGPVRIICRSDTTISAEVFAGASSNTRNNGYRCKANAATQTMMMLNLPPGTWVKSIRLDRRTAFAGGGSATTIEAGIAGNTTKYLAATDIRSTGTVLSNLNIVEGSGNPTLGTGTLLVLTVRNTGANVSALTSGTVLVSVELGSTPGY